MDKKLLNSIKALLFDLGGVIIDIDFDNVFSRWALHSNRSLKEIKTKFRFDRYYEAHERGEIDSAAYFNSLRKSLGIDITDMQFEDGWNSIYNGEMPGVCRLLKYAREKYPIYVFTNSNQLHQKTWSKSFSATLGLFSRVFNSSEIGKRKPEPGAFQTVADLIGVELNELLFYDDSIENVNGAKELGIRTVHVKSISDIELSLKELLG